ncbi:hypothetical protein Ddc_12386 [Ditylenchus destructor]|nr:hypothetical protein Ddc_12386 [Ditylenchus destructor]
MLLRSMPPYTVLILVTVIQPDPELISEWKTGAEVASVLKPGDLIEEWGGGVDVDHWMIYVGGVDKSYIHFMIDRKRNKTIVAKHNLSGQKKTKSKKSLRKNNSMDYDENGQVRTRFTAEQILARAEAQKLSALCLYDKVRYLCEPIAHARQACTASWRALFSSRFPDLPSTTQLFQTVPAAQNRITVMVQFYAELPHHLAYGILHDKKGVNQNVTALMIGIAKLILDFYLNYNPQFRALRADQRTAVLEPLMRLEWYRLLMKLELVAQAYFMTQVATTMEDLEKFKGLECLSSLHIEVENRDYEAEVHRYMPGFNVNDFAERGPIEGYRVG